MRFDMKFFISTELNYSVWRINKNYISKGIQRNVRQVEAGLDAVRDHGQETWKVCWKARGIDHMWHSMFKVGFDMFHLSSFWNLKLLILQTPGGKSQFTGLEVRCTRIGTVSWYHSILLFQCCRFRKTCKLLCGPWTFSVRFERRLRAKFKRAAGRMVLWFVKNEGEANKIFWAWFFGPTILRSFFRREKATDTYICRYLSSYSYRML